MPDPAADRPRVEAALRQAGAAETKLSLAELVPALVPPAAPIETPSRLDGTDPEPGEPAAPLGAGTAVGAETAA